jgi:hypothetical protein
MEEFLIGCGGWDKETFSVAWILVDRTRRESQCFRNGDIVDIRGNNRRRPWAAKTWKREREQGCVPAVRRPMILVPPIEV